MNAKVVLGIETSCDETAIAVMTSDKQLIVNELHSQISKHASYGGVVPEIAARSHAEQIKIIAKNILKQHSINKIDAIAVTAGPGLIGGVIVGVMFAKGLASYLHKPCFAINHLEGHALMPRFENDIAFPYLLLLASGGHCQLIIVKAVGKYELIGETLDDAAGEAFDKVGKMLNIPYPGGPNIEIEAKEGDENAYQFPKPFFGDRSHANLSFSGLKTAVKRTIEKAATSAHTSEHSLSVQIKKDICASFQKTVAEILAERLEQAINQCINNDIAVKAIVFSGGVASNKSIRAKLHAKASKYHLPFFCPSPQFCTDNGAMIAWAGIERISAGINCDNLSFKPKSRWPLNDL